MTEESGLTYHKYPRFGGNKSQWRFYKVKIQSALAQRGLSDIMVSNDTVALDSKTWTEEQMKTDDVKKKIKMRDATHKVQRDAVPWAQGPESC